jgi:hypothetical protein
VIVVFTAEVKKSNQNVIKEITIETKNGREPEEASHVLNCNDLKLSSISYSTFIFKSAIRTMRIIILISFSCHNFFITIN